MKYEDESSEPDDTDPDNSEDDPHDPNEEKTEADQLWGVDQASIAPGRFVAVHCTFGRNDQGIAIGFFFR